MPTVEQSVDVNVDVTTAYDQWTRFDSFPQWMEGVASVDQTDGAASTGSPRSGASSPRSRARPASGTPASPSRPVTHVSLGDHRGNPDHKPDSGQASFEPLGDSACRVTFVMTWEPEGDLETPSEVLAAVDRVVAADLARFKDVIEARGAPRAE